ncbi:protein of unknown function [Candidatus Nitrosotalea okcheonensis]|uniref:Uncharacterized protein n=1 Tax=Candidatus Nitrosotalea okcheonensis TaxID=1903276 RepID=A0A2H1FG32_9ARCH|nr:protein of unknown function [Candidatus Nitrosotalea okcheonensis]
MQADWFLFFENLGTSHIDPPTIPHMIRHGRKARSTGATTTKAGLCRVNAKYVEPMDVRNDTTNIVIFLLLLILELHNIIVFSFQLLQIYPCL